MVNKLRSLIPPELQWQIGKTAASIAFVRHAEHYIQNELVDKDEIVILQKTIEEIKTGMRIFIRHMEVEEFLNSNAI